MVPEKSIVIQILFLGKVWFFKATFKIFIFLFSFQWFNSMYDIDFFFHVYPVWGSLCLSLAKIWGFFSYFSSSAFSALSGILITMLDLLLWSHRFLRPCPFLQSVFCYLNWVIYIVLFFPPFSYLYHSVLEFPIPV